MLGIIILFFLFFIFWLCYKLYKKAMKNQYERELEWQRFVYFKYKSYMKCKKKHW